MFFFTKRQRPDVLQFENAIIVPYIIFHSELPPAPPSPLADMRGLPKSNIIL